MFKYAVFFFTSTVFGHSIASASIQDFSGQVHLSAQHSETEKKCAVTVKTSFGLSKKHYTLKRTFTDAIAVEAGETIVFKDVQFKNHAVQVVDDTGVLDGVTYNYALYNGSQDNTSQGEAPVATATCTAARNFIVQSALSANQTCFLALSSGPANPSTYNPYATYEWGYSASNPGWTGAEGNENQGYMRASCGNTAVCSEPVSTPGTYYFAVRETNQVTGEVGLWSANTVTCNVP